MKTKVKIWTRVLLVCVTMSLFCVNVHSAEKKTAEKKKVEKEEKKCDCGGTELDRIELNVLTTSSRLK